MRVRIDRTYLHGSGMERGRWLGTWAGPGYLPVEWTLPDLEASLRRRCRHRSLLSVRVLFSELRNLRAYVRARVCFGLAASLATTVPTSKSIPFLFTLSPISFFHVAAYFFSFPFPLPIRRKSSTDIQPESIFSRDESKGKKIFSQALVWETERGKYVARPVAYVRTYVRTAPSSRITYKRRYVTGVSRCVL